MCGIYKPKLADVCVCSNKLTLNLLAFCPAALENVTCRSRGRSRVKILPPFFNLSTTASWHSTNITTCLGSTFKAILTQPPPANGLPPGSFAELGRKPSADLNSSCSRSARVLETSSSRGRPSCFRWTGEMREIRVAFEVFFCRPTRCKPRMPREVLRRYFAKSCGSVR